MDRAYSFGFNEKVASNFFPNEEPATGKPIVYPKTGKCGIMFTPSVFVSHSF